MRNPIPKITEIVSQFKRNWVHQLDVDEIESVCSEVGYSWRARLLSPGVTVQLFLLQVLLGNTSCSHLRYFSKLDFSAASYCNARLRIPLKVLQELLRRVGELLHSAEREDGSWRGHRVWLADGTGCSMPDTDELQEYFGQPGGQRKGCGFPVAHLLVLINAGTGMLQKMLVSPLRTHDISRAAELSGELGEGDILVQDRGFCSFAYISLLAEKKIATVIRVPRSHRIDFRQARKHVSGSIRGRRLAKLGKRDQLVQWHKPATRPPWMSKEQFEQLPSTLAIREIGYSLDVKAFRSTKITLLTTLVDPKKYPASAIIELYGMRWEVEINLRHLKISMKMDVLKCKTVDGVLKELCVFCLVYNLIRQAMLDRAQKYHVPSSRISFIDTMRYLQELQTQKNSPPPVINQHRPGRRVARVVKRRPKAYPRMRYPRVISIGITPAEQLLAA